MPRLLASLLVPVLLVAIAPAAPVPTHLFPKTPAYYFPTTVGTTWVYENQNWVETQTITKAESISRGVLITIEKVHEDGRSPFGILLVSTDSVTQLEFEGNKLEQPLLWLKTPPKPKDTWDWKFINGITGTDTVVEAEKLKLPAGTFDAMRVDSIFTFAGGAMQPQHASHWYAEGVGLLQSTYGGINTRVLKSFKLGKE
jgi:hypothetical protein